VMLERVSPAMHCFQPPALDAGPHHATVRRFSAPGVSSYHRCLGRVRFSKKFSRNVFTGWWAVFLLGFATFAFPATGRAAAPDSAVKAVLLFHLTQFVNWPPSVEGSRFEIGILGPDPIADALEEAVKGEKVSGRPILIKRSNVAADLAHCQIIYVSPHASEATSLVRATVTGRAVLMVGEGDDFFQEGGMVRFTRTPNRKIRLEVDLDNVRSQPLKISSQLLRVCIVKGGPS
jgi:YfiR/HmsC-like